MDLEVGNANQNRAETLIQSALVVVAELGSDFVHSDHGKVFMSKLLSVIGLGGALLAAAHPNAQTSGVVQK